MKRGQSLPRGVVTFLFTDIEDSTALWDRHPDEMSSALVRHEAVVEETVAAHGGTVLKGRGEGDSTLSVFATATEGVAAASALAERLADETWPGGMVLCTRIALDSGEAMFREGDYFGGTLNRGARIRNLATGGRVLLSQAAAELAGDDLPAGRLLNELGPHRLRGLSREEVLFELADGSPGLVTQWPRSIQATVTPPVTGGEPRLVGREEALVALDRGWTAGSDGSPFVCLTGELGVGKTRLIHEFAGRVHRRDGATVLYGNCDEGVPVPYGPLTVALGKVVATLGGSAVAGRLGAAAGDLSRLVPELADHAARSPAALHADAQAETLRLFDAVCALLEMLAEAHPLLLAIDDLQWATESTVQLLRHVAARPPAGRVMVLLAYRPSDLGHDHPARPLLGDVARNARHSFEVRLEGLSTAAVEELVGELVSGVTTSLDAVARSVHAETAGNPFFVTEIVRVLVDGPGIADHDVTVALHELFEQGGVPSTVDNVVAARLARLGPEVVQALQRAAVLGAQFDVAPLAAMCALEEHEALMALGPAEASGFVSAVPERPFAFRFSHAVVRAAVADQLPAATRAALHLDAARAVAELHRHDPAPVLAEIAHHYDRAGGPPAEAVPELRRAGDQALDQLDFDQAALWYQRALELHESVPGVAEQRFELLIALGDAQKRAGRPEHRATLLTAAALARDLDDPERLARAALVGSRGFYSRTAGVDQDWIDLLDEATSNVTAHSTAARASLMAALASELVWSPDGQRRFELSDRALDLARQSGDDRTLAHVLLLRIVAIWAPDTHDQVVAGLDELTALAARIDDPVIGSHAERFRGGVAMEECEPSEAERHIQAAHRLADRARQPDLHWNLALADAAVALWRGELDEADERSTEARKVGDETGQPESASFAAAFDWEVRRLRGTLEPVAGLVAVVADAGLDPSLGVLRHLLAVGDVERAERIYRAVVGRGLTAIGRGVHTGPMLVNLAPMCARLGDREAARELYDRLLPHVGRSFQAIVPCPVAAQFLGVLAHTAGRPEWSDAHFRQALDLHEGAGAPLFAVETRLEWARTLELASEDRTRRMALLDAVEREAEARGAYGLVRAAQSQREDGP